MGGTHQSDNLSLLCTHRCVIPHSLTGMHLGESDRASVCKCVRVLDVAFITSYEIV